MNTLDSRKLVRLVAPLCSLAVSLSAQSVLWDQQNLGFGSGTYFSLPGVSPVGQQFIPALGGLDIVSISFGQQSDPTSGATFRIHIHEGGDIFGPIVGSSLPLNLAGTAPGGSFIDFSFPEQIALVPGNLYVLELQHSSGDSYGVLYGPANYPNGQAIVAGSAVNTDLVFREGMLVPEPSVLGLAFLAILGLWSVHRLGDRSGAQCRLGAELGAAPNGGPATQLGNSGVTEGPPSVS